MSNITTVVQTLANLVELTRSRVRKIPGLLLMSTASRRPGFSSILTSAKIYTDMLKDGVRSDYDFDSVLKNFVLNVVDKLKRGLQDDGVCLIAIPPEELQFRIPSGNVGGESTLEGSNTNYVFVYGIIR